MSVHTYRVGRVQFTWQDREPERMLFLLPTLTVHRWTWQVHKGVQFSRHKPLP